MLCVCCLLLNFDYVLPLQLLLLLLRPCTCSCGSWLPSFYFARLSACLSLSLSTSRLLSPAAFAIFGFAFNEINASFGRDSEYALTTYVHMCTCVQMFSSYSHFHLLIAFSGWKPINLVGETLKYHRMTHVRLCVSNVNL